MHSVELINSKRNAHQFEFHKVKTTSTLPINFVDTFQNYSAEKLFNPLNKLKYQIPQQKYTPDHLNMKKPVESTVIAKKRKATGPCQITVRTVKNSKTIQREIHKQSLELPSIKWVSDPNLAVEPLYIPSDKV